MTDTKKKNRVLAIDDEAVDDRVAEDPARARGLRGPDRDDRHARRGDLQDLEARRRRHRHDAAGRRRPRAARKFKQTHADTEVIVITGHGSVPKAVEAMKAGAYSFVEKPIEPDTLLAMLERAIERRDLRRREPAAQAEARRAVPLRQHHRQEQEDARAARAGGERRRQRRQHPDPGRERHRQGADRQRASTTTASARRGRSSRSTARRSRRT